MLKAVEGPFNKMVKIGAQKIDTNIFLAPLAGVADLAFRLIVREHGAKLCFFEMVDSNSLVYDSAKSRDILNTHPEDVPIAAQILGGDPEQVLAAARVLLRRIDPVFLDLNAACPVKKILKKKSGAYLMTDPKALCSIIKLLTKSLSIPITVKLRSGFDKYDQAGLVSLAQKCEQSGAAAIFLHGRTRSQFYSGQVDYAAIRAVKKKVEIPVFGSGDVLSAPLAKKMFEQTGCDGILVARGAIGRPWIFREIEHYLQTGQNLKEFSFEQKIEVLKKHLSYMPDKIGLMRSIAIEYLKGWPKAAMIRRLITKARTSGELLAVVDRLT